MTKERNIKTENSFSVLGSVWGRHKSITRTNKQNKQKQIFLFSEMVHSVFEYNFNFKI